MRVLADRIAVIPLEDPPRQGLIWFPEQGRQRVDQGIVKYRGKDVKELRVGDHVLFSGYDGDKVSVDGEVLIILREDNVKLLFEGSEEVMIAISQVREFVQTAQQLHGVGLREGADLMAERLNGMLDGYFFDRGLEF